MQSAGTVTIPFGALAAKIDDTLAGYVANAKVRFTKLGVVEEAQVLRAFFVRSLGLIWFAAGWPQWTKKDGDQAAIETARN